MIALKVCMLGSFAVGKTSLARRAAENLFDERYLTTIGVRMEKKELRVDGREVRLIVWDVYGDDDLQSVKSWHVRDCAGYLLVADGTRRGTVAAAVALRERLLTVLRDAPFLFVLNKRDLADDWQVGAEELEPLAHAGWTLVETSAKTGAGVEAAFEDLARRALAYEAARPGA